LPRLISPGARARGEKHTLREPSYGSIVCRAQATAGLNADVANLTKKNAMEAALP